MVAEMEEWGQPLTKGEIGDIAYQGLVMRTT